MVGGVGGGGLGITPTPFRFMAKTEGLLWMDVKGPAERRPSVPGQPKQMLNRLNPGYSFHPSLSFSSAHFSSIVRESLQQSFCKVFNTYGALIFHLCHRG